MFTIKYKSDATIEKCKARLVAKGYTQSYGIYYQETCAPVAKINSIWVLLSLAANNDYSLQQLNVKNTFLYGNLEEVFMDAPGFEKYFSVGKVCKLKKSLYGLKQSPTASFERFSRSIIQFFFQKNQDGRTLFIENKPKGKLIVLIMYMDDIILTGNDVEEMKKKS